MLASVAHHPNLLTRRACDFAVQPTTRPSCSRSCGQEKWRALTYLIPMVGGGSTCSSTYVCTFSLRGHFGAPATFRPRARLPFRPILDKVRTRMTPATQSTFRGSASPARRRLASLQPSLLAGARRHRRHRAGGGGQPLAVADFLLANLYYTGSSRHRYKHDVRGREQRRPGARREVGHSAPAGPDTSRPPGPASVSSVCERSNRPSCCSSSEHIRIIVERKVTRKNTRTERRTGRAAARPRGAAGRRRRRPVTRAGRARERSPAASGQRTDLRARRGRPARVRGTRWLRLPCRPVHPHRAPVPCGDAHTARRRARRAGTNVHAAQVF